MAKLGAAVSIESKSIAKNKMATFGPKSPVEVGWILGLVMAVGSVIWYASAANSKLASLVEGQAGMVMQIASIDSGMGDMRKRIESLEAHGSPAAVKEVEALKGGMVAHEKDVIVLRNGLNDLLKAFRLHVSRQDPLNFPDGGKDNGDMWSK